MRRKKISKRQQTMNGFQNLEKSSFKNIHCSLIVQIFLAEQFISQFDFKLVLFQKVDLQVCSHESV